MADIIPKRSGFQERLGDARIICNDLFKPSSEDLFFGIVVAIERHARNARSLAELRYADGRERLFLCKLYESFRNASSRFSARKVDRSYLLSHNEQSSTTDRRRTERLLR